MFAYFVRKNPHPWRWMLLGLGGTLFAGTQVMLGFIEGFRVIEGDSHQWSEKTWSRPYAGQRGTRQP